MIAPVGTISAEAVANALCVPPRLIVQFLEEARRQIPDSLLHTQIDDDNLVRRAIITLPTGDMLELNNHAGFIIVTAHDNECPGRSYFSYMLGDYIFDTAAAQAYRDQFRETDLLAASQLMAALHDDMAPLYRKVHRQRRRQLINRLTGGLICR